MMMLGVAVGTGRLLAHVLLSPTKTVFGVEVGIILTHEVSPPWGLLQQQSLILEIQFVSRDNHTNVCARNA